MASGVIKTYSNIRKELEKAQWENMASIYIEENLVDLFILISKLHTGTTIDQLKSWKGNAVYDNLIKAIYGVSTASPKFTRNSIKLGLVQHLMNEINKYLDPQKTDNIYLGKYIFVIVNMVQYDEVIEKFREINSFQILEKFYKNSRVYAKKCFFFLFC